MHLPQRKSGDAARARRAELYKHYREHQRSVAASDGGTLTTYQDGFRSELTYGGAPYGEHAISAFWNAIRRQNFFDRATVQGRS